jgi:hypothetical protein
MAVNIRSFASYKSRELAFVIAIQEPQIKGKIAPLLNKHHAVNMYKD